MTRRKRSRPEPTATNSSHRRPRTQPSVVLHLLCQHRHMRKAGPRRDTEHKQTTLESLAKSCWWVGSWASLPGEAKAFRVQLATGSATCLTVARSPFDRSLGHLPPALPKVQCSQIARAMRKHTLPLHLHQSFLAYIYLYMNT